MRAYFIGLPVVWSKYVFMAVLILSIILFFLPNVIFRRSRRELSFFHRGMCVLLAWVMFISPEMFNQLSESAIAYSEINVSSWGKANREIIYEYDDNGSVTQKVTNDDWDGDIEIIDYIYDLANRLVKVITEDGFTGNNHIVEYEYNDEGIRVKSHSYDILWNENIDNEKTVVYLTDSYNHTGYSQTLEEETETIDYINGVPQTPVSQVRTYFIGDDVIAHKTNGNTQYLLYDGHGSTRQLATYSGGTVYSNQNFSYDGYGVFLQSRDLTESTVRVSEQPTSLLYAGEHFDFNSQQYYNRARWYNPLSGLFNQMDPYSGNTQDPQSLHKYLYCHANPVNATDPSGKFIGGIADCISTALIRATLYVMDNGPKLFAYTWAAFKITGAMWLATMSLLILQELGVLPHDELVAEIGAILGLVLIAELFILTMIPTSFASPPNQPKGINDPRVKKAVDVGLKVHYDKTTDMTRYTHEGGPTQLQQRYPNTTFDFARRGQSGVDVKVIGEPHPSKYPGSTWPSNIMKADFKPDTPTGNAFKLPSDTLRILYDPENGVISTP
ncbi:MAG: RHS repeat-associated core domain-containing protein [Phycisphaerae bacterium]